MQQGWEATGPSYVPFGNELVQESFFLPLFLPWPCNVETGSKVWVALSLWQLPGTNLSHCHLHYLGWLQVGNLESCVVRQNWLPVWVWVQALPECALFGK